MNEEKDTCSTLERLFKILLKKLKSQFNKTIKSLQFHKISRPDGENMDEWMGRLQISAIECNYQELYRQLKDQFKQGLNDTHMLGEIIWELTKIKENGTIMSKNVLAWAKRVEVQRPQSAVMNSLTEVKKSDKIKVSKHTHKDSARRHTQTKMSIQQACRYCGSSHPPRQCLAYGKSCTECGNIGHFRAVRRSRRTGVVHKVEQETVQDTDGENNIELVSINSIQFNRNHSILTAKLKTSAGQSNILVLYKIDSGSDGNIMPLHVHKNYFLRQQMSN